MGIVSNVSRLIERKGQTATLIQLAESATNSFGDRIDGTETEIPVTVLVSTYATEIQFVAARDIDVGDLRIFLSVKNLTVEPKTTNKLRVKGKTFRVIRVAPLAPDGEVIHWELQVRDG